MRTAPPHTPPRGASVGPPRGLCTAASETFAAAAIAAAWGGVGGELSGHLATQCGNSAAEASRKAPACAAARLRARRGRRVQSLAGCGPRRRRRHTRRVRRAGGPGRHASGRAEQAPRHLPLKPPTVRAFPCRRHGQQPQLVHASDMSPRLTTCCRSAAAPRGDARGISPVNARCGGDPLSFWSRAAGQIALLHSASQAVGADRNACGLVVLRLSRHIHTRGAAAAREKEFLENKRISQHTWRTY